MKTKIFLDFDGTLIRSKLMKESIFEIVSELGYSKDEVKRIYEEARNQAPFHPYDFIDSLAKERNVDSESTKEKLARMIDSLSKQCLYDDSANFLDEIDRKKYEINLITYGHEEWQRMKVENTGCRMSFDNLYYVGTKDKWKFVDKFLKKNEKFIFVDDFAEGVVNMKSSHPNCLAIYMERDDTVADNSILNHKKDVFRVNSFDEVMKIIET
ncbi:hypothetical protein COT78_03450 [Candidatus Berkelbacteria bacterium CG10_big_fil_rev_8_21_14_0_10_43_13]|uniref:HAD family hydrolase n=1 Tax=Candidatus Berkelbacteria bacterium CG10_big_fil_rev_8_21_14_0_10_43_13 TaxID=1974514 RepID=A0A2H0W638_9BACT|nr:MAG: hypothetical protein COT78_03450 [Candidatus Berkelbacteria bacterium CG10_big_fil_rev_8_21_14_0_10_43_13]